MLPKLNTAEQLSTLLKYNNSTIYIITAFMLPFRHHRLEIKILYYCTLSSSLVAQSVIICLQCRRPGVKPLIWKIPSRRKWQCTPVSLLEKSHGQWSLVGYSLWGCKESGPTERLTLIVLHTVLYSKVHKSTPTCLGCAHNNVCQICELTNVIAH